MINKRLEIDKLKPLLIQKSMQTPITSLTWHVHKPLSPVSSSLQLKSTIEGAPYFSEKTGAFNVVNLTTYLGDAVEITKLVQTGV